MTDFAFLFETAATIAVVVVPLILVTRWLGDGDGASLADLFAIPVDPPLPLGSREEEPIRWRIEALRPDC